MDNQTPYNNNYIKYGPQQPVYNQNYNMGFNPQWPGYNPLSQANPALPNGTYQQPGPTLQSMNQSQITPVFGKWIDSPSEIAPKDVPMDGTVALFPSRKGDVIYAKAWDSNGAIATIEFHPVRNSDQASTQSSEYGAIMEKLSRIEERLQAPVAQNNRYNQRKDNKETT